jgi:hypothetical protein
MRPSLQQALKICEQEREANRPPCLALLGPPGCGKTDYLGKLYDALTERRWKEFTDCLRIDLREFPVGASDDVFRRINSQLIPLARERGIDISDKAMAGTHHQRFGSILAEWLKTAPRNFTLFVDHLDSVPRHFALDFKNHMRALLERDNFDSTSEGAVGAAQLGLIVAGAISLFELRQDPSSPLLMCKPIILPPQERPARKQLVKEQLASRLRRRVVKDETINYLVEATGGEPVFLAPLLDKLLETDGAGLEGAAARKVVETMCSNHEFDSAFWNLALHLWSDRDVRRIVGQLSAGREERPAVPDVDIDRYHLGGAVVLEGRTNRRPYGKYRFRNDIVKSFLEKLAPYFEGDDPASPHLENVIGKLRALDKAKASCAAAGTLWEAVKYLKVAWGLTTPYNRSKEDVPYFNIYIADDESGSGWWVNPQKKEVIGPEKQVSQPPEGDAARVAVYNALQGRASSSQHLHSFLGWSESQLSLAVSLSAKDPYVFVVVTLPRERAGSDFTEFNLNHWALFLQGDEVEKALNNLTLAQLGRDSIERLAQPRPVTLAAGCDNVQRLYWSESGVVSVGRASVTHLPGRLPQKDLRFLGQSLRKLLSLDGNQRSLHETLTDLRQSFAAPLERFLEKVEGLAGQLQHFKTFAHLISVTDEDGLLVPLELFPIEPTSYLGLELPVTRQLYDGVEVAPEHCLTFPQLITSLQQTNEPLQALLVVSDPYGDLEATAEEGEHVRAVIERGCEMFEIKSNVRLLTPEEATLDNIANQLWQKSTHIFHYVGHVGAPSGGGEKGSLVLRDPEVGIDFVDYERLSRVLRDTGAKIWFAYVSSCAGASFTGSAIEPKGVGEALLNSGVPNFLGFREPISDESARFFAEKFYGKLFPTARAEKEFDIGDAVLAARREASARVEHVDAWVTSLLLTMGR